MTGRTICLLGIDVGTTMIKVAAFEAHGRTLVLHRCPTPTKRMSNGWAEHDADELWHAIAQLVNSVVQDLPNTHQVGGLSVTSVGEAIAPIDEDGQVLYPIIAWFDKRTAEQANWWMQNVGIERIYQITGMPLDAQFGANKILWIKQHHPEVLKRTRYWLSVADYVINRLSGVVVTDQSMASRTMLFDQLKRSWSDELLEMAGLDPDTLPNPSESGMLVGGVTLEASQLTGLVEGTPVVLGGHDHLCGAYVSRQGQNIAVNSTGTAEVLALPVSSYIPRNPVDAGFIPCYADVIPGQYVYSAKVGYAGALIDWLRREVVRNTDSSTEDGYSEDYKRMIESIPQPLKFSGLVCYTTFGRPTTPNWDTEAVQGAFLGLTLSHHRGHLLQAILEGLGYSLRANIEAVENLACISIETLRVEGGATKNHIWMQLKADITNRVIESIQIEEPTVLGAAILAGVGIGALGDHREAARGIEIESTRWMPEKSRWVVYDRIYRAVYSKLPTVLKSLNRLIQSSADETSSD